MKLLIFILAFVIDQSNGCDNGWISHGDMCYHFSHDTEDWLSALEICRGVLHAQLVEIEDATENSFLEAEAKTRGLSFWIGLNDLEQEGTWVWATSGRTLATTGFSDWSGSQPSNTNGNENCATIFTAANYHWNDNQCNSPIYNFICEKQAGNTQPVG